MQVQCFASLLDMPFSPHTLRPVVVARHTAPQPHAQHLLLTYISSHSLIGLSVIAHASTYVFFSTLHLSSTSSGMSVALCRQQAARAYRAHRDPMPSQVQLDSIWRRKSVGKDCSRWLCGVVMSVYELWIRSRGIAAAPSSCHVHRHLFKNARTTPLALPCVLSKKPGTSHVLRIFPNASMQVYRSCTLLSMLYSLHQLPRFRSRCKPLLHDFWA